MAWGRALTGVRFVHVEAAELRDFMDGSETEISRGMRRFFSHLRGDHDGQAAMLGRRCVALSLWRRGEIRGLSHLVADGTYVCQRLRRAGLGVALADMLWQRILVQNADCEHVAICVRNASGWKFVAGLAAENADRVFRVIDSRTDMIHVLRAA